MNCKFSFICLSLILLFFSNIMAQPETKVIAFVSKTSVVDENGVLADKPFIDDLLSEGYKIDTLYTTALETSDSLINVLNSADLVIIGRSGGSGDFGGAHKAAWNAITTPILLLHPWAARNSRLNWLPTGTTNSFDTGGDTISAKIEVPDDTVFVDATIEADSTMDWVYTPYDYMGTTDGGNGTVLARSADGNVLFERWDPWVEFYNGTHDGAAGYRTLIGNGNDHANATSGAPFNYYNFTPAAKQVYLNEVARMLNLPAPPPKPIGFGKTIAFVGLPGKDNPDTPEEGDADKPFIDDLVAAGYTVNTVYTSSLETASQGFVDSLNNADLVIIGRSGSSGDFGGTHKAAWNAITSPLMALHLFVARNNRLNWLPTATATAYDNVGDTMIAKIEVPDDPVFTDATIAADSTMGWVVSPYDYMETTDGGNGTVLARDASNSNVLFVRWDPWVYFYNGAGDYAAGYRTYIGNGNDHASASTGGPFNYYNFTDEAKQVYMNEVARMANLPAPPEKPAGLGKTIAFISLPGKLDENGVDADKPFIDDLEALEYTVDTHYSSSLESDSALVDTLNNVDLVVIGRSGASGDFGGSHKAAWNNITSPLMLLHLWAARNNRLNWLNTGTTTSFDTGGDTISAKIEVPDDSVFVDATIAADSTMGWVISPYDYMETTDGGNGTVLAREAISSNVLFERWDPWVEFYNGAVDMPAGYRTLIGNGNDHANSTNGAPFNYYNFTDAAKQVYMNEVARMAKLGKVEEPVSVAGSKNNIPNVYALEQNYPNPFNPTTTIEFALPKNSNVKIAVFDILGRLITKLVDGNLNAGYHKVQFNASNLASGVYFYRIEAGNFVKVKKLMLLK